MNIALRPLLLFAGALVLIVGGLFLFQNFKAVPQKASLLVETPYTQAEVFLDGQSFGPTPLEKNELSEGERTLKLVSGSRSYQSRISLLGRTQTVVRHEFGPSDAFSSGEVLYFGKTGKPAALSVTSDPDGVKVKLDGAEVGETPVLVESVKGGTHDLLLSFKDFETRRINVRVEDGYQLRISSKLALIPLSMASPQALNSGIEKVTVFNLTLGKTPLYVDKSLWLEGALYWAKTRGVEVAEAKFDYFADSEGTIFDSSGQTVKLETLGEGKVESLTVGYLLAEGGGLSEPAKAALYDLAKRVLKKPPLTNKVKVLPTGTGWLRVRSSPSLAASEVARVNVGEKFELLEEKEGWARIKLPSGLEGWVSLDFVEKIQEAP